MVSAWSRSHAAAYVAPKRRAGLEPRTQAWEAFTEKAGSPHRRLGFRPFSARSGAISVQHFRAEVMNQKIGRVNPAVLEEESLTKAFLADCERAEQRKKDAAARGGALQQLCHRGAQIAEARAAAS